MKRGDLVTIYEDPLTEKRSEGEAYLVSNLARARVDGLTVERWMVRFVGYTEEVEREVLVR